MTRKQVVSKLRRHLDKIGTGGVREIVFPTIIVVVIVIVVVVGFVVLIIHV